MTVIEAREYISRFHLLTGTSPITFVETSSGRRVWMDSMNDEEAIQVAYMLKDMVVAAGRPAGVPVQ